MCDDDCDNNNLYINNDNHDHINNISYEWIATATSETDIECDID